MAVAERLRDHLHPWLASLRDDPSGEAAFWARVAAERAPLIEPDPARPGHSIVTYVFPAPPGARHVVAQPGFGQAPEHVMERTPGTNVCWASYSYRNDVRTSYSFAPDAPLIAFDRADATELAQLNAFWATAKPAADPHHREHFVSRAGDGLPDDVISFLSLGEAPDESVVHKRPDVARGWIERHEFTSPLMGNTRRIWVYTPPGYGEGGAAYPLLVAFDGGSALSRIPTQRILDNLLADRRMRPAIAVFIDNATAVSRNVELPCNETFARFIEAELMPWLTGRYRVSAEPGEHVVTGASYGGLASLWLAYRLPHVFGTVISQAASLWWGPGYDIARPRSAGGYTPGWLIDRYEESPRLPVRFWMEVGLLEPQALMIEPNRRMKAVLEAKGCQLTYSEPCGGHDTALWRGTLATALEHMLPPVG
jgi:enterochelin esterase family protein